MVCVIFLEANRLRAEEYLTPERGILHDISDPRGERLKLLQTLFQLIHQRAPQKSPWVRAVVLDEKEGDWVLSVSQEDGKFFARVAGYKKTWKEVEPAEQLERFQLRAEIPFQMAYFVFTKTKRGIMNARFSPEKFGTVGWFATYKFAYSDEEFPLISAETFSPAEGSEAAELVDMVTSLRAEFFDENQ